MSYSHLNAAAQLIPSDEDCANVNLTVTGRTQDMVRDSVEEALKATKKVYATKHSYMSILA